MKKLELKKGKIVILVTIVITCLIVTMAMFMQFKLVNKADETEIEQLRKTELTTMLTELKAKNDDVDNRQKEVNEMIEQYQSASKSEGSSKQLLEEELEKLKLILGQTAVEGPGIKITIVDNDNYLTADRLLLIINSLKSAGAEAIAINNNRIVFCSDIVDIQGYINIIKVNQVNIYSPYIIEAIGDPTALESVLNQAGGEIYNLEQLDLGMEIQIEQKNKIVLDKYDLEYDYSYLQKEE